jgi:hypothetical protein
MKALNAVKHFLDLDDQELFLNNWSFRAHNYTVDMDVIAIGFIVHQFHFSDYYRVCKDIEIYSNAKYDEISTLKIKDKLEDILETLYPMFFSLYSSCYGDHPNPDIDDEIHFMKFLINDLSEFEVSSGSVKETSINLGSNHGDIESITSNHTAYIFAELENNCVILEKENVQDHADFPINMKSFKEIHRNSIDMPEGSIGRFICSPQSDFLLEQGTVLNNLLLHKDAIQVLTNAIDWNSSNRDAYIERALAYFETNQFALALQDYESAKKLTIVPPFRQGISKGVAFSAMYIPENKTEFSSGLISGAVDGAKLSTTEFFPSLLGSCRGILSGLWAFVCSPKEVSQDMIDTAYVLGEFVSTNGAVECLHCVVPELRDLSVSWKGINDFSRGQKIGYIIGKYGIDIFAPLGALKGISKVKALKRANTMCTLEACAASEAKKAKILEESLIRATARESLIAEATKSGKILVKNSNVQYHVMQQKHAWDKVIKITGNIEEDFKRVVMFLEENAVLSKECFIDSRVFDKGKVIRSDYGKTINGIEVRAVAEFNVETNLTLLNDAWVIKK